MADFLDDLAEPERIDWDELFRLVGAAPTAAFGAVGDVVYDGEGDEVAWVEKGGEARAASFAVLASVGPHLAALARHAEQFEQAVTMHPGPCNCGGTRDCYDCYSAGVAEDELRKTDANLGAAFLALTEAARQLRLTKGGPTDAPIRSNARVDRDRDDRGVSSGAPGEATVSRHMRTDGVAPPENGALNDRDAKPEKCGRCHHPAHLGFCNKLVGGTAYRCRCTVTTLPRAKEPDRA